MGFNSGFKGLNAICHLLALSGTHPILHISRIRVKSLYMEIYLVKCFVTVDSLQ